MSSLIALAVELSLIGLPVMIYSIVEKVKREEQRQRPI